MENWRKLSFDYHQISCLKLSEPQHDKTNKMACAPCEDSDQPGQMSSLISLCYPHEESLGLKLPIECTAKTLFRLGRCPGGSESSLGSQSFCWFCHGLAHLLTCRLIALCLEVMADMAKWVEVFFLFFLRGLLIIVVGSCSTRAMWESQAKRLRSPASTSPPWSAQLNISEFWKS